MTIKALSSWNQLLSKASDYMWSISTPESNLITSTSPGPLTLNPNTNGTVGTSTTAPSFTFGHYVNSPSVGNLYASDIQLQGLGSVKELLQNLTFVIPPQDLDVHNPAVMDALQNWHQAVQAVRERHEQLQILIKLTNEPR